jgi:ferredoxin
VTTKLEVVIDRGLCMGTGECVFIAEAVFQLDTGRKAVVINAEAADETTLLNAVASCPNFAITVLRDGVPIA